MAHRELHFTDETTTLHAYSNARDGIRLQMLDTESDDRNWRCTGLLPDEAVRLGIALIRWAADPYGLAELEAREEEQR